MGTARRMQQQQEDGERPQPHCRGGQGQAGAGSCWVASTGEGPCQAPPPRGPLGVPPQNPPSRGGCAGLPRPEPAARGQRNSPSQCRTRVSPRDGEDLGSLSCSPRPRLLPGTAEDRGHVTLPALFPPAAQNQPLPDTGAMGTGTPWQHGHRGSGDTVGTGTPWQREGSSRNGSSAVTGTVLRWGGHPRPPRGCRRPGNTQLRGRRAGRGDWQGRVGKDKAQQWGLLERRTASPASHPGQGLGAEHGLEQLPQKRWQRPSPSRDPKGDLTAPSRVFPTHGGSTLGWGSLGPSAALPSILPSENATGSFGKGRRNSSTPSQTSPGGPKVWGGLIPPPPGQPGLGSLPPEPEGIQGAQEVTTASL